MVWLLAPTVQPTTGDAEAWSSTLQGLKRILKGTFSSQWWPISTSDPAHVLHRNDMGPHAKFCRCTLHHFGWHRKRVLTTTLNYLVDLSDFEFADYTVMFRCWAPDTWWRLAAALHVRLWRSKLLAVTMTAANIKQRQRVRYSYIVHFVYNYYAQIIVHFVFISSYLIVIWNYYSFILWFI